MLPSFAQSFSSARFTDTDDVDGTSSLDVASATGAAAGPATDASRDPPRPITLPPLPEYRPSHRSSFNRPYSNSMPATRTASPANVSRKRSHEMASHQDSSGDETRAIQQFPERDSKAKNKGKGRSAKSRALPDVDERTDMADAEDEDEERPRQHPALVRVKVEDGEDGPANGNPSSLHVRPRPRPSSPSAAPARRLSISTTTPVSQGNIPSPLYPRDDGPSEFPNYRHSMHADTNRNTPSSPSSSNSNIQKKRRVTISGASLPSSNRSFHVSSVSPISPAVMGFNIPGTPGAVDQLRNALTLKQQQKALIDSRRASQSLGATPEPKPENGGPPSRSQSRMSIASMTSPISPLGSSDAQGTTASFTSFSTAARDDSSRASSPGSPSPRRQRSHRPSSLIATASSSAVAAALDIEMEVEEHSDATTQLTRRRGDLNLAAVVAPVAASESTPGPGPRRARPNPNLTVRTSATDWDNDTRNARASSRSAENSTATHTIPPRSVPPLQPMDSSDVAGERSGYGPGMGGNVGFTGERIRRSAHSSSNNHGAGGFKSPHLMSPPGLTETSGPPAMSSGPSHRGPLPIVPPYQSSSNPRGNDQPYLHPPAPSMSNPRRMSLSTSSLSTSNLSTPLLPPFPPPSSHPQRHNSFSSTPPVSTYYPTPRSSTSSNRPNLGPPQQAHADSSGTDELVSKTAFMNLFEDVYDAFADARRMRAWLDDQQQRQVRQSHGFEGYVREEDLARIVDDRVSAVREETRRDMDALRRRVRELEERLEGVTRSAVVTTSTETALEEHRLTPRALAADMEVDREATPAAANRRSIQK